MWGDDVRGAGVLVTDCSRHGVTAWAGPVGGAAAILRTTEVKSENVLQQGEGVGSRLIWICWGGTSPQGVA